MVSLALIVQKGGAGKTTAATNLAVAARTAERQVVLVDLDPQGSASTWHAVRQDHVGADIALEVANASTLARLLAKHKDAVVILDTPPHNSTLSATVLDLVDMAVVPVRPSAFDLAAVSDTAQLVRRSRCGLVGSILNAVVPQSPVSADVGAALADAGLPVVGQLHQRMAYQHAAAAGLGVVEYEPRGKAAEEIIGLWGLIARQLAEAA